MGNGPLGSGLGWTPACWICGAGGPGGLTVGSGAWVSSPPTEPLPRLAFGCFHLIAPGAPWEGRREGRGEKGKGGEGRGGRGGEGKGGPSCYLTKGMSLRSCVD